MPKNAETKPSKKPTKAHARLLFIFFVFIFSLYITYNKGNKVIKNKKKA